MADFQLSGNTVLSESSGSISWGAGAPAGTVLRVVKENGFTSYANDVEIVEQ